MKKKAEMINKIMEVAQVAKASGKYMDMGDLFLGLAFRTESELIQICREMNIKA